MLRHSFNRDKAAQQIEQAVFKTLAAGTYTQDIAGNHPAVNTEHFVDALIEQC
jgi:isocitrate/isopropylmalate dehydrogenase